MMNLINPVFIGHGSPMNAISSNAYADFLGKYAKAIPAPKAIVVISAHWQTEGTFMTGSPKPEQIYDFYGFPEALYKVEYSPRGSLEVAEFIRAENIGITIDRSRGIDHAGWAVVKHMYPNQDIPLLEMSLDMRKTNAEHFALGGLLGRYCGRGILFIGSGNVIHNLSDISFDENEKPFPWAVNGDAWIKEQISSLNIEYLLNYEKHFPHYARSIPTNEHYLPLLYILGMATGKSQIKTIYEEIQNGSISMRSIEVDQASPLVGRH